MNNSIKGVTLALLLLATVSFAQDSRHLQESVSKSPMVSSNTQSHDAKPSISTPEDKTEQQIVSYILHRQPDKGLSYAKKIGGYIVSAAREFNIDPYIVAATADIESTYDMHSTPQIGIMQFTHGTGRDYIKRGFHIHEARDNIRAGACLLAEHYAQSRNGRSKSLASRGGNGRFWREPQVNDSSLRYMWGRYNGCGSRGGYVRHAISRYNTIRSWAGTKTKPSKKHKK